jgi:predicted aspartyl protease
MIPVTFINGEESLETTALLDSGADFVALTKDMAEALGFDLSGPREHCVTPVGSAEAVEVRVTIRIAQGHESYTLTVPAKVLLVEHNGTPPLLGRIGFFDEFEITFNQNKERIWLKKIDSIDRA